MRTMTENCGAREQGVATQMSPDLGVRESRSWTKIWRRGRCPGRAVSRVGAGGGSCSHPRGSTCILPCSFWELIFSLWLGNAYVAVKKPQNYVFLHLLRLALSPHSVTSQPSESTLQIFHHHETCYIKIKNLTTAWSSQKSYCLFLLWLILIELGSKCPCTGVRK